MIYIAPISRRWFHFIMLPVPTVRAQRLSRTCQSIVLARPIIDIHFTWAGPSSQSLTFIKLSSVDKRKNKQYQWHILITACIADWRLDDRNVSLTLGQSMKVDKISLNDADMSWNKRRFS